MDSRKMAVVGSSLNIEPGQLVGHKLGKGLILEIVEVHDDGLVKAKVVHKGSTRLWEGSVTTFRAEYLTPV